MVTSALALVLAISACSSARKIDGGSEAAFDLSHARLVESLSPEDRLRLTLAEAIVLAPVGCLTSEPIPGQPFLTDSLGGQAVIRSCRKELHGMTFKDIMSRAYPQGGPGSDGHAQVPPNDSFKP
jgi:hypothetical protein